MIDALFSDEVNKHCHIEIWHRNLILPSNELEIEIHNKAKSEMGLEGAPRRILSKEASIKLLENLYHIYDALFSAVLWRFADIYSLQFILEQYDITYVIDQDARAGGLTFNERNFWQGRGPILRRALKYIAEKIVIHEPRKQAVDQDLNYYAYLICITESIFACSLVRDEIKQFWDSGSYFEITPKDSNHPFVKSVEKFDIYFQKQRMKHLTPSDPGSFSLFDPHSTEYKMLDKGFLSTVGVSLSSMLEVLVGIIGSKYINLERETTVPIMEVAKLRELILSGSNISSKVYDLAFGAFSINRHDLIEHGREAFKPSQEYRLQRRGFLLYNAFEESHVVFSPSLAKEALEVLVQSIAFSKLPYEWSAFEGLEGNISRFQQSLSKRWELTVEEELKGIGYQGKVRVKKIGPKGNVKYVPSSVGEIDYLGISPNLDSLLLLEVKLINLSTNPNSYSNDLEKLIIGEKSPASKLILKANWVFEHHKEVSLLLANEVGMEQPPSVQSIYYAIVTYFPTMPYLENQVPIVCFHDFLKDYSGNTHWPYSVGRLDILL